MNEIREIKLEDLEESFFEDLREGNFILVLGAGGSYGIPNKHGKQIPIGNAFAEITKSRFKDDSSYDYASAAQVWRSQIKENLDLIEEFKNHFLVDESKFDYKFYSSIFIPKWYNIYTLNFDNVLEEAQKVSPYRKLKSYSYPEDTSGGQEPSILHLHGSIVEKTNLEKSLVFTPESYTNLGRERNTLYNGLYSDVKTHHKKILILGSQFKEAVVLDKFFEDLPKNKSVEIYHFDVNNYNKHSDAFTKRNTTYVKLEDNDGHFGTDAFLNLLLKNKHKIRRIELPGSLTIDKGFEEGLKKGKAFNRSQFYSAKQDDNCQWYGITNGFDVIRKDYSKIKQEVLQAFSTTTISKVVAVVYGAGGCGKSTLLRRLALELNKEVDFGIIWVKDNQLENFVLNALPKIQADIENRYLVFVEDWYRLISTNTELGDALLKTTQSINNIRLVIGDRDIRGKNYVLNLMNRDNVFELSEIENEYILKKIISKHTDWQDAFNQLTKQNTKIYNSSLFIILFAIAGIQEKRIDINDWEFTDLENTVRRIAKYDLKKIVEHYPGFAKALHYWACIYARHKIFISYATFLAIADFYNGDKKISSNFKNWKLDNDVLNRLKLYINVSTNENLAKLFRNIDVVQFNHDKLSESVLAEIEFPSWEPYDDIQKRNLLEVITDNGDNYSASFFLKKFLDFETQIFENNQEKRFFIDKLFYEKKNWYFQYLSSLTRLNLNSSELYEYIEVLKKQNLYHPELWLEYFRIGNTAEKKVVAYRILTHNDLLTLSEHIVVAAFGQSGNDEEKQSASKIILTHNDLLTLRSEIVVAAFGQSGNEEEKQEASRLILTHKDLLTLRHDIVVAAFGQSGNEVEKQEASKRILTHNDLLTFPHHFVNIAFNQSENEVEKQLLAKQILTHNDLLTLSEHIVILAFRQSGNDGKKEIAAKKILQNPAWNESKNYLTVLSALNFYSMYRETPNFVTERIKIIINAYFENKKGKLNRDFFFGLMNIPFHQNKLWKKNSKNIISKWNRLERRAILKVLHSYIAYPESIKGVCEAILENWRVEIVKKIYKFYGKPYQGDHIRISLGHPALRPLAEDTAVEIIKARNDKSVDVPDYLFEIAEKIVNDNIYPEWEIRDRQKS